VERRSGEDGDGYARDRDIYFWRFVFVLALDVLRGRR